MLNQCGRLRDEQLQTQRTESRTRREPDVLRNGTHQGSRGGALAAGTCRPDNGRPLRRLRFSVLQCVLQTASVLYHNHT